MEKNLFIKGGKVFEDFEKYGCVDKDCIRHVFYGACCICGCRNTEHHEGLQEEVSTCSLRIAGKFYNSHMTCDKQYYAVVGTHYCRVIRDGKYKRKFHKGISALKNHELYFFEDESDPDWDGLSPEYEANFFVTGVHGGN